MHIGEFFSLFDKVAHVGVETGMRSPNSRRGCYLDWYLSYDLDTEDRRKALKSLVRLRDSNP
jgi:hypothetical protein